MFPTPIFSPSKFFTTRENFSNNFSTTAIFPQLYFFEKIYSPKIFAMDTDLLKQIHATITQMLTATETANQVALSPGVPTVTTATPAIERSTNQHQQRHYHKDHGYVDMTWSRVRPMAPRAHPYLPSGYHTASSQYVPSLPRTKGTTHSLPAKPKRDFSQIDCNMCGQRGHTQHYQGCTMHPKYRPNISLKKQKVNTTRIMITAPITSMMMAERTTTTRPWRRQQDYADGDADYYEDKDAEDYDDDEAADSEEQRCRQLRRQGAREGTVPLAIHIPNPEYIRPWGSTLI